MSMMPFNGVCGSDSISELVRKGKGGSRINLHGFSRRLAVVRTILLYMGNLVVQESV